MASSFIPTLSEPATPLGDYRLLSPNCGLRVSPLCLGGMSLGDAWTGMLGGGISKEQAFELLDTYYEAGGNFIDTANRYQEEQSEKWIGEWMTARGNRDEIVLATKYSLGYRAARNDAKIYSNYTGNQKKSLMLSLRDSLEKLQTTYIDIMYIHWWDYSVSIPEMMRQLDDVVKSGKVLHLGISDTPAYIVSRCNEYARNHALTQFVVYQGEWSCLKRDIEREILPMARMEEMGVAPWGVIGSGRFFTAAQLEKRLKEGGDLRFGQNALSEDEKKISAALEKVAGELGSDASLANVAIAYTLHKQPYVFPIIGGKKVSHLKENIKALSIHLTQAQIEYLESAVQFDLGWPLNTLGGNPAYTKDGRTANFVHNSTAKVQWVKATQSIA
ncbi:norsolorinic acid reductase [Calocera viscosa TUFC12733]|uniref:Norsolorinic acid reductase n=1 Tax=Calocera viscosa (strain TUFC12733) TaxID=1330018 RepID=A0A167J9U8_CALVF|nr:norsolorinic acid reductase [Calocera viscosa TUFC12733]